MCGVELLRTGPGRSFRTYIRGMRPCFLSLVALLVVLGTACGTATNEPPNVPPDQVLSRDPYMGVSCQVSNSFACDRVGLAVWLREPATRVRAAIADREFELDDGVEYHELRGVMLECDVEVERDPERVADYGLALVERYASGACSPDSFSPPG